MYDINDNDEKRILHTLDRRSRESWKDYVVCRVAFTGGGCLVRNPAKRPSPNGPKSSLLPCP